MSMEGKHTVSREERLASVVPVTITKLGTTGKFHPTFYQFYPRPSADESELPRFKSIGTWNQGFDTVTEARTFARLGGVIRPELKVVVTERVYVAPVDKASLDWFDEKQLLIV